jgi:hypothetical protein
LKKFNQIHNNEYKITEPFLVDDSILSDIL